MTTPSPYSTARIRSDFLDFFQSKGHTIVPSAPLVPGNDPTLLFTNSGMVQFKDVFLGAEKRSYVRAADVQRCLRAGGKHNDLDSVGYTARHHTFFEMLGNWSFGDYFKQDAIAWAWELLTGVWKLPAERLLVTVYHTDDEAYALWRDKVGVPEARIVRIGDNKGAPFASDNFWQMADTGPCGPCTEIFYDHGPSHFGGPPGSPDEDGDRFIEIWNLVFMQFDRKLSSQKAFDTLEAAKGAFESALANGEIVAPPVAERRADGGLQYVLKHFVHDPLPAPCVDTGMGLERLAAILQHVHSNYEIDLFQALIRSAAELTGTADLENKSLRVIADHIRACSFLIVDGVLPSNEGRGYVLRRIIRRALRHGWMLGTRQPFFHRLVGLLAELMGDAYPELAAKREFVERALLAEEERFGETLDQGMGIVNRSINEERALAYASQLYPGEMEKEPVVGHSRPDAIIRGPDRVCVVEVKTGDRSDLPLNAVKQVHNYIEVLLQEQRQDVPVDGLALVVVSDDESKKRLSASECKASSLDGRVAVRVVSADELPRVGQVNGDTAFRLYDTYGFPFDLTQDIAREHGLSVDTAGFDAAMERQRDTARAAGKFGGGVQLPADLVAQLQPTQFVGYDALQAGGLVVQALLRDGRPVESIAAGDEAIVILDRTPFYAESGGQVGDTGELDEQGVRFRVSDTQKLAGQFHGHVGRLEAGTLRRGDHLLGAVDAARRGETLLNHSATHLLHGALRGLLGTHVAQKGSLVAPDRLRFDFSHFQPVTGDELAEIERRVNLEVRANHPVVIRQMAMQEAIDAGAIALFGEKYGEQVRVVAMGDSVELCGGTHVARTGDIGLFKLVAEGGVSAGVRRVEALTGQAALDHVAAEERRLKDVAGLLGGTAGEATEKLRALIDRQKKLERELDAHKARAASGATADLAAQAVDRGGIRVLAVRVEGLDAKALRDALDRLRQQLGDAAVVLAGASDGKVALVAGVSGAASGRIKAGELVGMVAGRIGGKGGGRPDMAQGGGSDGPALAAALADVPGWIETKLSPG